MINIEKTLEDLEFLNALCHGTVLDDAIALLKKELETVVHCKDCKRYYDGVCQCEDTIYWYREPEWYCADGERRDGDA